MSHPNSKRRKILVQRVGERDGFVCWICGEPPEGREPLTLDHVIPRSEGGTSEQHNLRLAHGRCNNERAHPSIALPRLAKDLAARSAAGDEART